MSDSDLRLHIEGPDAERLVRELSRLLETELGAHPRREQPPPPAATVTRTDPLTVAAVVLAIPGAILAGADLAERLKIKQKAGRLIAWAREKAGAGTPNRVEIVDVDGRAKRLDAAEAAEVIEIAVVIAARITRRREG